MSLSMSYAALLVVLLFSLFLDTAFTFPIDYPAFSSFVRVKHEIISHYEPEIFAATPNVTTDVLINRQYDPLIITWLLVITAIVLFMFIPFLVLLRFCGCTIFRNFMCWYIRFEQNNLNTSDMRLTRMHTDHKMQQDPKVCGSQTIPHKFVEFDCE